MPTATIRPAYTHRSGQVFLVTVKGDERLMSPAEVTVQIAAHRTGAKSPFGGLAARRVSADLATQLERASDAAAMFNRLQAARGQTSTSVSVSRGSAA